MGLLNIGEIIKSERKKKNMTQEELSFGLCTTATLSRIENCQHTPSRDLVIALLERLGDVDYNFSYIDVTESPFDFDADLLKAKIVNYYQENKIVSMYDTLKQLEDSGVDYDILDKQFVNTYQLMYLYKTGQANLLVYKEIQAALFLTIKNFSANEPFAYILTSNEQKLIFLIGVYHKLHNNLIMAETVLAQLAKNQEQFNNILDYQNLSYIEILNELIQLNIEMDCYDKAYSSITKYLDYCKQHTLYNIIPSIKYSKACCEVNLGKIDDARESIVEAYFHLYALHQIKQAEELRKKAKSELDISFIIKLQRGDTICKTSTLDIS